MEWTTEQKQVIELKGKNILVSAAAGSGKTAVLVERIINKITDKDNPVDIDRLLVVTFTKAAAAEMRQRIGDAIEKKREEAPDDRNLLRQSALIHNAQITTIDSFCLFVVRNHFGEINLDPNFRIADEGELRLLERDVLDEVFEREYQILLEQPTEREDFQKLVDAYSGKRNDQAVKDMVAQIYRMSCSSPWPKKWIRGLAENYRITSLSQLKELPILTEMTDYVGKLLADDYDQLLSLRELAAASDGPNAYLPAIESDLAMLAEAKALSGYEELYVFFGNVSFAKLAAVRKFEGDAAKKDAVQNVRNQIKKDLEDIRKKYFRMTPEEMLFQMKELRPVAEELCRLSLLYLEAISDKKRKRRMVDFSDIEHFALQILVDEDTGKTRRTAEEFRRHFEEIMIDEYQDSNQVQEEILCAISREEDGGHNRFMVGDVKQSIYRFRLARPELFMEKYKTYQKDGEQCQRIDLHRNFRSRKEVVDFSNDVFAKIMKPDLGDVDYDERAALYCGAVYPKAGEMKAEVLLLDTDDSEKKKLEARMTAERICRLMKETNVTDKGSGQLRPMRFSDIVILFRSLKDWGTEFAAVLAEYGIPAHVESSTGYFSAPEVQTVLNMLRILDNPLQDIPMAAVLKSPMAGLTEEELAEIRVSSSDDSFAAAAWESMKRAAEGETELLSEEKLKTFYEIYRTLRREKELPIHELIVKILSRTGYGNYAAALPAGEKRAANLHMLLEKAIAYEKTSYKGLFHFIRYIDQLQKYEIDFGEADTTGENEDVVHIMTIHKSKGLEFPVVFVSGLSKGFNQMDAAEKLVLHPDLGLGIHQVTMEPKIKHPCFIKTEIAEHIRRENLGEELRVLYVALTRAKEKLILTGTVKDAEKTISGFTGNVLLGQPISFSQRVKAKSYTDWIIPAVLSYPGTYELTVMSPEELTLDAARRKAEDTLDYQTLRMKIGQADPKRVGEIAGAFSYVYPYRSQMDRKSKYSVSELKHDSMLQQYDAAEGEAQLPDFLLNEHESYVPDFARETGAEENRAAMNGTEQIGDKTNAGENGAAKTVPGVSRGALRGTAVHRVMECLDFAALAKVNPADEQQVSDFVSRELSRMENGGEITTEMRSLVPESMIESFAKSSIAGRMAAAAQRGELFKEKPFVMEQDGVLIQGIIDVFWMEGDHLAVLDYKTDRVESAEELVMRYETQLKLYAKALDRIFGGENQNRTTKETFIYSFRLKEVVTL
jgi:ATP-dependent helicase/nuclease subunit A